ncbi:MAG: hypothetical protein ACLVJH_15305 [Faecalibacterium prausnitzii]
MKKRKSKSWSMAYCGMAAALCVALMLLGTIIPIAMFIAPAVASFLIATVCMECGITMAVDGLRQPSVCWGCSLCRIKRVALTFTVLLGYYPLVKPRFRPHPSPGIAAGCLQAAAVQRRRCLPCTVCCLLLVPAGSVSQELRTTATGNVPGSRWPWAMQPLLLYDRALHNLLMLYKAGLAAEAPQMLGVH